MTRSRPHASPKSAVLRALVPVAVLVAIGACGENRPVRIGIAVPSGWYDAITLAVEEAELREPIELVYDTTRGIGETLAGYRYAEWLVSQDVAVVIGHDASRPSIAAATVYNAAQIPQVVPMATSRALEEQGPWSFALAPSDSAEGEFLAAFVDTVLGVRRVALLYNNDEFGVGLRDGIVPELLARGVEVVDERYFAPLTKDGVTPRGVRVLLRAALMHEPDALIVGARSPGTLAVARYLRQEGIRVPLVCGDASWVLAPEQRSEALEILRGAYIVRFWGHDRDSLSAAFAERFRQRFGRAPDHAEAKAYDAAGLVLAAVAAGARRPDRFRDYFTQLGRTVPPYQGVAGAYVFDHGRVRTAGLDMGVVTDSGLIRLDGAVP